MEKDELVARVIQLDRRVDKIYTWAAAAFMTASLMMGVSTFWIVRWIDRTEAGLQVAIPQIQTDVALIKRDQDAWREENKRAWSLINKLMKNEAANER